jgi:hypothetical protein
MPLLSGAHRRARERLPALSKKRAARSRRLGKGDRRAAPLPRVARALRAQVRTDAFGASRAARTREAAPFRRDARGRNPRSRNSLEGRHPSGHRALRRKTQRSSPEDFVEASRHRRLARRRRSRPIRLLDPAWFHRLRSALAARRRRPSARQRGHPTLWGKARQRLFHRRAHARHERARHVRTRRGARGGHDPRREGHGASREIVEAPRRRSARARRHEGQAALDCERGVARRRRRFTSAR